MYAQHLKISDNENKKRILTKAFIRMAEQLHLSRQELSMIMGASESTLSRYFNTVSFLDPESKEGQLVILLLRAYRGLEILFGGNMQQSQLWLRSNNKHLHEKPIQLIQSIEGLIGVVQYLEFMSEM